MAVRNSTLPHGSGASVWVRCRMPRLSEEARARLFLSTYDEVIRFNVVLIDDRVAEGQGFESS